MRCGWGQGDSVKGSWRTSYGPGVWAYFGTDLEFQVVISRGKYLLEFVRHYSHVDLNSLNSVYGKNLI